MSWQKVLDALFRRPEEQAAPWHDPDTLVLAANIAITRQEIQSAVDPTAWLRQKTDALHQSMIYVAKSEVEKRGWATIEYRENAGTLK